MNRKNMVWCKPVLFLIGLALLFSLINPLFTVTDDRVYQSVEGFYEEKPNSLDVIYIGASNVYASWQGPAAWEEFGITGYGIGIPSMPAVATKYMIEECRKTQPDALYIVNLNNFKVNGIVTTESDVHNVTNFLPLSTTKVALIDELAERAGFSGMDKAEFYFPVIRFHSAWEEFLAKNMDRELDGLKGASYFPTFLRTAVSLKDDFCYTSDRISVTQEQQGILQSLVSYIQKEGVNALFVFSPQVISEEKTVGQINTLKDYVLAQGLPVLDLMENIDALQLDLDSDFYNAYHCNVHGALKFTRYLSAYLKENYGFRDKRGDPAYAGWDAAAEEFAKRIKPYALPFEIENMLRSNDLAAPKLVKCTASGTSIQVNWQKSAGASGYAIYRQHRDRQTKELYPWEFVTEVDADTLHYTDEQLLRNTGYKYTVVPLGEENGGTVYGNFDISGIAAMTTIPNPKLLALEETDAGITVSWEAQDGVDSFIVYRKLPGQRWVNIGSVDGTSTTFTDSGYEPQLPYIYSVKAGAEVNGQNRYSGFDAVGLLRYAELQKPEPTLQINQDGLEITWDAVEGAGSYSVYVRQGDAPWQVVAKHITDTVWVDADYAERENAEYIVSAEFRHSDQYYKFHSAQVALEKGDN